MLYHTHYHTDDSLASVQREFMERHYQQFEDGEENKFIYTDIFKQYVRRTCVVCFTARQCEL